MTGVEDEQAPDGAPFTRQDLFSLLGALGALLTLATATMYYFGWRRSDVQARAMEMDVTMFGFSTQDYVLRGISSLYAPVLVLGALVIGWLGVHKLVVRALASPRLQGKRRARVLAGLRWTSVIAATIAIACVLYTWEGAGAAPRWPVPPISRAVGTWRWTVPALLVVATLIALYAVVDPPAADPRPVTPGHLVDGGGRGRRCGRGRPRAVLGARGLRRHHRPP